MKKIDRFGMTDFDRSEIPRFTTGILTADRKKLEKHVHLCIRNLASDRVKCCATCPFEDQIVAAYPELRGWFRNKRRRIRRNR
jgi:hypothetical protein